MLEAIIVTGHGLLHVWPEEKAQKACSIQRANSWHRKKKHFLGQKKKNNIN